jgi:hypothetical protein
MATRKHPGAVALGKRRMEALTEEERQALGRKGGKARLKKMTKTQRSEIAKKAAQARWGKKKAESEQP